MIFGFNGSEVASRALRDGQSPIAGERRLKRIYQVSQQVDVNAVRLTAKALGDEARLHQAMKGPVPRQDRQILSADAGGIARAMRRSYFGSPYDHRPQAWGRHPAGYGAGGAGLGSYVAALEGLTTNYTGGGLIGLAAAVEKEKLEWVRTAREDRRVPITRTHPEGLVAEVWVYARKPDGFEVRLSPAEAVKKGVLTQAEADKAVKNLLAKGKKEATVLRKRLERQEGLTAEAHERADADAAAIACRDGMDKLGVPAPIARLWCSPGGTMKVIYIGGAVVLGLVLLPTLIRIVKAVRA